MIFLPLLLWTAFAHAQADFIAADDLKKTASVGMRDHPQVSCILKTILPKKHFEDFNNTPAGGGEYQEKTGKVNEGGAVPGAMCQFYELETGPDGFLTGSYSVCRKTYYFSTAPNFHPKLEKPDDEEVIHLKAGANDWRQKCSRENFKTQIAAYVDAHSGLKCEAAGVEFGSDPLVISTKDRAYLYSVPVACKEKETDCASKTKKYLIPGDTVVAAKVQPSKDFRCVLYRAKSTSKEVKGWIPEKEIKDLPDAEEPHFDSLMKALFPTPAARRDWVGKWYSPDGKESFVLVDVNDKTIRIQGNGSEGLSMKIEGSLASEVIPDLDDTSCPQYFYLSNGTLLGITRQSQVCMGTARNPYGFNGRFVRR